MSANISKVNEKEEMAYVGDTPWHKLGVKVEGAMTSEEAIKQARLNWIVEKIPVEFTTSKSVVKILRDKFVTVRTDIDEPLGVVGSKYRVLNNKEAFSFFDAIVGEKLAMYHTVGALGMGKKIWMLAKLPDDLWITKEDKIEKYLLLINSHDGSSSVTICATPIRVVCQNTLNLALQQGVKTHIRHTLSIGIGIEGIRKELGIANSYYKMFEDLSRYLISKKASSVIVDKMLKDIGLGNDKCEDSKRANEKREEILGLFEGGRGNTLQEVKGSTWALLNGVVEYVDYKNARSEKSRAESILMGDGLKMKQDALDSILNSVK